MTEAIAWLFGLAVGLYFGVRFRMRDPDWRLWWRRKARR